MVFSFVLVSCLLLCTTCQNLEQTMQVARGGSELVLDCVISASFICYSSRESKSLFPGFLALCRYPYATRPSIFRPHGI